MLGMVVAECRRPYGASTPGDQQKFGMLSRNAVNATIMFEFFTYLLRCYVLL
jgi:hypothetical protein